MAGEGDKELGPAMIADADDVDHVAATRGESVAATRGESVAATSATTRGESVAATSAASRGKSVETTSAAPRFGETRTVTLPGGAVLELVWCPPGVFTMGSPASELGRLDGETPHRVTLTKGFWLGKYPVTQRQWASVMGSNPSYFKGDDRPVEEVSWNDCQAFCERAGLGLRLPTEAEWEYACRAGSETAYAWGNALNGDRANCDGSCPCGTSAKGRYREATTPVGTYAANAWGLFDMHGNVWEWCADLYGEYPRGAVTDPTGAASGDRRVGRGGSWSQYARYCRSANRDWDAPDYRFDDMGFRVACSAGPQA